MLSSMNETVDQLHQIYKKKYVNKKGCQFSKKKMQIFARLPSALQFNMQRCKWFHAH